MGQGQLVVAPGIAGREALIKKAACTINGLAAELQPEADLEAVIEEAALPVFAVAPDVVVIEEAAVALPVIETPVVKAPVAEVKVVAAPDAKPAFVAPELANVVTTAAVMGSPAPKPVINISVVNTGAQAAIMAALLPFLICFSYQGRARAGAMLGGGDARRAKDFACRSANPSFHPR